MEVNDNYERNKKELEDKIVKIQKSHDKVLLETTHLRSFFAGIKDGVIRWESSSTYVFSGMRKEDNHIARICTWTSGPTCKFFVQCRFGTITLGSKARVLLDKTCRSPEEAARGVAISDADLTSKYKLKNEGIKVFRAVVKHVLGIQ